MNVIKENVEKDHQNTLSQLVQIINQEIVMKLKNKGGDGVCDESLDCRAGRYCTPKG